VAWSSSSPSVATVSGSGLVSTLATGATQLTATLGSVTQQASLTVTAAQLESIAVQASQSSFPLGLSLQLTAIGTYSDSSTQNLTSQVGWSSATPSVGVVSAAGSATGVATGSFNARATLNGVTGSLAITVTNAVLQSIAVTPASPTIINLLGNSVQFTATGTYSDGSTQNRRPVAGQHLRYRQLLPAGHWRRHRKRHVGEHHRLNRIPGHLGWALTNQE
jgi:hypothetical protein